MEHLPSVNPSSLTSSPSGNCWHCQGQGQTAVSAKRWLAAICSCLQGLHNSTVPQTVHSINNWFLPSVDALIISWLGKPHWHAPLRYSHLFSWNLLPIWAISFLSHSYRVIDYRSSHFTKIVSRPRSTWVVSVTRRSPVIENPSLLLSTRWRQCSCPWECLMSSCPQRLNSEGEIFAPFHFLSFFAPVSSLIKANTSRSGNPTNQDCLYPACVQIWQLFINHCSEPPHWWSPDPHTAQLL